ncbi:MAG: alpha/beta hydrolase, partial [Promethearchaeota archaeon]
MLSNNYKRLFLILIDLLISWGIWEVNIQLGNPCTSVAFSKCFILSTTTFLIVYTPFEIYWSFRDLWFDRWIGLSLRDLDVSNIKLNVPDGVLSCTLVKNRNQLKVDSKRTIIVICHGFSDTMETLQYFYYPLAIQGYIILAYDARGTGKSKKVGKRGNFLKRIEDFKNILNWIQSNEEYSQSKINCVGFSIGALTILCGGFQNEDIEKIIAISSMSNFKQNIPKYNPIVLLSYLMKGVRLFPVEEVNYKLSPYLIMNDIKERVSVDTWITLSKRVMLIHSKNDKVIKFKNFKENSLLLDLPRSNLLVLKKGGHSQKKNENA